MQEELRIYLLDNSSPEVYDLMTNAMAILDDLYPVDIHNKYLELIMIQDTNGNELIGDIDVLESILLLTKHYLNKILNEHGIIVNEDIPISKLIILVEAMIDIQDYEDTDTILNIINLEIAQEEKIAEILSLITPIDQSEILLELESVDTTLIDRLKEFICRDIVVAEQEVDISDDSKYLNEIKSFSSFTQGRDLIAMKLIESGVKPGYLFNVYLNMVSDDIQQLDPTIIATELLAFCFISLDGFSNPKATVAKHLESIVSDMRLITRIDIKLNEILSKYLIYKENLKLKAIKV